jgi:hypothetical protein
MFEERPYDLLALDAELIESFGEMHGRAVQGCGLLHSRHP